MGVPTRDEIHELTRRVEELNAKVDRLRAAPAAGGARPAAKKAGAPVATKAPKKG
jgi:outer membrane murein-binding lipoprotein Lpp